MSSGGAWTEVEKVELLMSIIDTHVGSAIKWQDVAVPKGRTIKSCTHVIAKLRSMVREGNGGMPTTPKKSSQAGTPGRKRNARDMIGNEHGDDDDEYHSPPRGTSKARVKSRKKKNNNNNNNNKTETNAAKTHDSDSAGDPDASQKVSVVKDEDVDGNKAEADGAEVAHAGGEPEEELQEFI